MKENPVIYKVLVGYVGNIDDEMRRKNYEIGCIQYNWDKNVFSFEDYENMAKDLGKYYYDIYFEVVAYTSDLDVAISIIEENKGDINDGGSFEYAAIVPVDTNRVYPIFNSSNKDNTIRLFKFDTFKDRYTDMKIFEHDEEHKFMYNVNTFLEYKIISKLKEIMSNDKDETVAKFDNKE